MRKKFKVLIRGKNYLIQLDESTQKHGFHTPVFVEARNSEQAESIAVDMLKKGASFENCAIPRTGLVLYVEEGKSNRIVSS